MKERLLIRELSHRLGVMMEPEKWYRFSVDIMKSESSRLPEEGPFYLSENILFIDRENLQKENWIKNKMG